MHRMRSRIKSLPEHAWHVTIHVHLAYVTINPLLRIPACREVCWHASPFATSSDDSPFLTVVYIVSSGERELGVSRTVC